MTEPFLSHVVVHGDQEPPKRLAFVLHGILGMGQNFRTLARRWAAALPGWGFVLPDLRGHGHSQGFAAPHNLDSVAGDLERLAQHLPQPVEAVIGHSFGGKAALVYTSRRDSPLQRCIVLDAAPGTRQAQADVLSADSVLSTLEGLPPLFGSREAFQSLLTNRGYPPAIVAWLAMNLRREAGELRLRLDLEAIRALLDDYFRRDLWPLVEQGRGAEHFLLVIAGGATTYAPAERARAHALASQWAHLETVELPRVGHWLHAEDPEAVTDLVLAQFSG